MSRVMMFSALIALCAVQGTVIPVAARSSGLATEDRWNPWHVDDLPAEIRRGIAARAAACGRPLAAAHAFALHLDRAGTKLIGIHFERLRCSDRGALCTTAGCLHQVYISTGGPYRLLESVHVPELDFTHVKIPPARRGSADHR